MHDRAGKTQGEEDFCQSEGSWLEMNRSPCFEPMPLHVALSWHRWRFPASPLLECFRADLWLGASTATYHAGHPEPRFLSFRSHFPLSVLCRRGAGSLVWGGVGHGRLCTAVTGTSPEGDLPGKCHHPSWEAAHPGSPDRLLPHASQ